MFSRMKKYVSMALASTMMLTAAFSNVTSIMGATNVTVITGKDVQPFEGTVAADAPKITVNAPASVEADEEFEVDFVLANNPGFSSYEFLIKYEGAEPVAGSGVTGENINDSKETAEPLIKGAVINAAMAPAVMEAKGGVYTTGYAKNDIDEPANAKGNGKLFSLKFKAKEAGSNVKISLQGDTMFLSSVDDAGNTNDQTFYVENAEVSVKSGPIKPVEQTINKITGKNVEPFTGEIPEGAAVIEVIPSNPTPALNEEIEVKFVISNNPGFSSYEFLIPKTSILEPVANSGVTGENINDSKETPEPLIKGAVINAAMAPAVMEAKGGVYTTGYAKNDIDEPANAKGNGILFSLKFKAVAEGSENVMLKGDTMFLSSVDDAGNTNDEVFYVKNGVVTVGGEADTTTETTTEATTADTETTTKDANTETTTTVVDPVTQTTTRKTDSNRGDNDRGSGGGSPSKNYNKDNNKKDDKKEDNKKDPSKEEDNKKDPVKPSTETKVKFTDVGSNYSWAENAINKLSDLGIINGVGDNKFAPQLPSKRGDFILMLTKVLGMKGTATSNFNDVPKTKYYYDAIGIAKDAGLAKGVGNNNFNPEGTITRQEMMTFVARALEYKNVTLDKSTGKLAKFSDASTIAPYAVDSVAALVNLGIVNGTGSKIEPARNITRAEMAVLMYNVYEYLVPEAFTTTTEATTESTTEGETSTKKDNKNESTTKGELVYKEILKEVEDAIDDFDDIKSDVEQAADDEDDDSIMDDYEDLVEKLDGLLTNVKKGEKYSQSKLEDLYDDVKDVLDEVKDFMKDYE